MQIVKTEELPQSYITEVRKLGATAVNADRVTVLYIHTDLNFRGCHIFDKLTGENVIVVSADLTGEELHQTLLHETWHCYNGDGRSEEPESVIEQRCCKMTGT